MKTTIFKIAIALAVILGMTAYSSEASAVSIAVAPVVMRRRNGGAKISDYKNPTGQAKMISVMDKFGSPGIKKQQGSTRILYDILPLAQGAQSETFTFFEDAQTRTFPFTNLTDGKLQVGESILIQRLYFFIVSQTVAAPNDFVDVESIGGFGISGLNLATFVITISNSRVVKPTPVFSSEPSFNRFAYFDNYNVFHFDTDITIPTLLEFAVILKSPEITVPASQTLTFYIGCAIEGLGAILAPRATF